MMLAEIQWQCSGSIVDFMFQLASAVATVRVFSLACIQGTKCQIYVGERVLLLSIDFFLFTLTNIS